MNTTEDPFDECRNNQRLANRRQNDNHIACLLNDEDFQLVARVFGGKHACRKGQPNFTSIDFAAWIQSEYSTTIHNCTARSDIKLGGKKANEGNPPKGHTCTQRTAFILQDNQEVESHICKTEG